MTKAKSHHSISSTILYLCVLLWNISFTVSLNYNEIYRKTAFYNMFCILYISSVSQHMIWYFIKPFQQKLWNHLSCQRNWDSYHKLDRLQNYRLYFFIIQRQIKFWFLWNLCSCRIFLYVICLWSDSGFLLYYDRILLHTHVNPKRHS